MPKKKIAQITTPNWPAKGAFNVGGVKHRPVRGSTFHFETKADVKDRFEFGAIFMMVLHDCNRFFLCDY